MIGGSVSWEAALRWFLMLGGAAVLPAGVLVLRPVQIESPAAPFLEIHVDSEMSALNVDSVAGLIIRRDPFRPERAPSAVPYSPTDPESEGMAMEASPPKPVLVLTGIVWGAEPAAIVEGLPETNGARLVHAGEVVGALKVRRITPDQVLMSGLDTTWNLTVRTPW